MTAERSPVRKVDNPVVDTAYGPVRGVDDGTVMVWKGVRYAKPPIGELRWRAPRPPAGWTEAADATGADAPVYTYRFDWSTPMLRLLRLGAAHATEPPYVWVNLVAGSKDSTFKLGGLKAGTAVSERIRTRWLNFAIRGEPVGGVGEPRWRPYRDGDRATLSIDRRDTVVEDLDRSLRAAWGDDVLSFR